MDLTAVPLHAHSFHELLTILTSALGCGLLIGLERERHKQREQQPSFAGLRSFAICALLGALCFLFGIVIAVIGALIVGGMVILSIKNQPDDPGITT